MTDEEFNAMVDRNEWHPAEKLLDLIKTVAFCVQPGFVWSWSRTPDRKCKYIDIRIDMRDGGFVVTSGREKRERISLEQLKRWGLKDSEGGCASD